MDREILLNVYCISCSVLRDGVPRGSHHIFVYWSLTLYLFTSTLLTDVSRCIRVSSPRIVYNLRSLQYGEDGFVIGWTLNGL